MKNNQSTGNVKRFLKEMIQLELVPALEEIVDQLPDELVGFSDAEQLLREEFIQLARRMLQGWTNRACDGVMVHAGSKPESLKNKPDKALVHRIVLCLIFAIG